MAQGEGASLLIRAYVQFKEEKYLSAAKKAIDFMLLSNTEGGCTEYSGEKTSYF
ncbi:D-glucuronyl C5-epimerase family protein [Bacteroides thetaiotaomicron]|nr:D-glucuronyl C5-epimerase family protein [Bacteroides thetaiotaomicron]